MLLQRQMSITSLTDPECKPHNKRRKQESIPASSLLSPSKAPVHPDNDAIGEEEGSDGASTPRANYAAPPAAPKKETRTTPLFPDDDFEEHNLNFPTPAQRIVQRVLFGSDGQSSLDDSFSKSFTEDDKDYSGAGDEAMSPKVPAAPSKVRMAHRHSPVLDEHSFAPAALSFSQPENDAGRSGWGSPTRRSTDSRSVPSPPTRLRRQSSTPYPRSDISSMFFQDSPQEEEEEPIEDAEMDGYFFASGGNGYEAVEAYQESKRTSIASAATGTPKSPLPHHSRRAASSDDASVAHGGFPDSWVAKQLSMDDAPHDRASSASPLATPWQFQSSGPSTPPRQPKSLPLMRNMSALCRKDSLIYMEEDGELEQSSPADFLPPGQMKPTGLHREASCYERSIESIKARETTEVAVAVQKAYGLKVK